jgi:hypothetical protein
MAHKFALTARAFPDYNLADLPQIPANFVEDSWRHDVCPSYACQVGDSQFVKIWCDYPSPAAREISGAPRYAVTGAKDEYVPFEEFEDAVQYAADLVSTAQASR